MVDPWTGPTPSPQQFPANEPNGIRKLLDKIAALELQIKEKTSNLLGSAGIRLTRAGMFIDSSLTVSGDLTATGTADFSGNTTIGGDLAVVGTLSLPAGIVDNDALATPVVQTVARAVGSGFSLSVSFAEKAGVNITVPPGCTQLQAVVAGWLFSYNPNTTGGSNSTGGDAIYCLCKLSTQDSETYPTGLSGSGGFCTASSGDSFTFTGLTPGAVLRLSAYGASAYQALAANGGNRATISAALSWLR